MSGLRHRDWHMIAEQRFRRRAVLDVVPQRFRGQPFIVLADRLTGQYLRLNARARLLWERLDGSRSMQELWRELAMLPGGYPPSQKELMDWTMQLSQAGLILSDHEIDPRFLAHRSGSRRDKALEGKAISPLALKIPLFDPSGFVRLVYPFVRPLFSIWGVGVLIGLFVAAVLAVILHSNQLFASADQSLLSQSGLWAMLIAYPLMKALHELGHAVVLYHYGEEVREAGVMLLIFFPVPYVDASASAAIPSHSARMLVGAAGMIVELAVAAVALLLWFQAEPGLLQAILYSFIVMGTISTLAFNGNPLLKFDAYYVLADWLQMPNLAQRAGAFLQDRFLAALLGLRRQEVAEPDEAPILLAYGIGSVTYRLLLAFVIVAIVAQLFFVVGMVLAVWSVTMSVIWPLMKMAKKGRDMARAENARRRVSLRLGLVVTVVAGPLFWLPLPFSAQGEGQIIALPSAEMRAGASGFVPSDLVVVSALGESEMQNQVLDDGGMVTVGAQVLQLENRDQATRIAATRHALKDIESQLAAPGMTVANRRVALARKNTLESSLGQLLELDAALAQLAPQTGVLNWVGGRPPAPGFYIERGTLIARVAAEGHLEAVISVPSYYAGELPLDGAPVELRLADGRLIQGEIARRRALDQGDQVPEALLARYGGTVAEDSQKPGTALAPVLAVWIRLAPDQQLALGQRVQARIALTSRSLGAQLMFQIDRIFLRVTRF